ncbi:tripartite tricarboxylate transporter TctB family protein [Arthrobacter sp.]|uniref:tripartite tricarboxylate transporter TctB family protein n=1 Tax=Arthrobacter sp. TaxID=1667 RepID=UPI003A95962A
MSEVATRRANRSELGFAALLGAVGAVVIIDAAGLHAPYSQADPVGPRVVPFIVGGLLLVCAILLAVRVWRGDSAPAEEGEDIDPSTPIGWRTVLPLIGFFILNIVLINPLGWVISGTVLFWGSVWALGSRHYVRDGIISLVMALGTFYGFYLGLGIHLPAGVLEGVL